MTGFLAIWLRRVWQFHGYKSKDADSAFWLFSLSDGRVLLWSKGFLHNFLSITNKICLMSGIFFGSVIIPEVTALIVFPRTICMAVSIISFCVDFAFGSIKRLLLDYSITVVLNHMIKFHKLFCHFVNFGNSILINF